MKIKRLFCYNALILASVSSLNGHASESGWYGRAAIGYSALDDTSGRSTGIGSASGGARIEVDAGFFAGAALGYDYAGPWAAEIAWEYRSNDSETTLPDGSRFDDGNYASNTFFINGLYQLPGFYVNKPYLGAGLGWIQEIDVDLESTGEELSYSGDGDIGWQIFVGFDREITPQIEGNIELRYTAFDDISLDGEEGAAGKFESLDYQHLSLQLGLNFNL